MKKRERKKLNNKIILFPDLEKRLLEKGLESLQQKKFQDAIRFFEEGMELEPENSEIQTGIVLAYFESGMLQKAKETANKMLQSGVGDFIQVLDLYLMILVQMHQYDEIVTTVEVLIEEREISKDHFEHFSQILQFARKMADTMPRPDAQAVHIEETDFEPEKLQLFSLREESEQMMLAARLSKQNIRPHVKEIEEYLQSNAGHLFFKTMLLSLLIEQDYDKEIWIEKMDKRLAVVPTSLEGINEHPQLNHILEILGNQLEHDDPILFENTKGIVKRHFLLTYPFSIEQASDIALAAAYHSLAKQYLGIPETPELLAGIYGISEEELIQAENSIQRLEEISSPQY